MTEDVFGIVGTTVAGAYHVEETVAEGGFGVVYRAYHSGFRAPVALKCLKIPQGLGAAGQELFLEQFRAEAELLFRLSASIPTVVRPLHVDALSAAGGAFVPFMALEWLEGETLEALVRRRKAEGRSALSLKKLARLLTPVARALERAHNFASPEGPISIVHRDLKPENIFLAKVAGEDVVKILDFGIGKAKSVASQVAGRASQSSAGVASFTPAYGAPEQWLPKRYGQTGPWTDVWGLALTVVESLAGRPVIDGDNAAMMGTTLDAQRRPTPRNEGIQVSDEIEAVFQRALAVDPRNRYADAGLFWNDLLGTLGLTELQSSGLRRDFRGDGFPFPESEHFEVARTDSVPPLSSRARGATTEAEAPPPSVPPPSPNEIPDLALPSQAAAPAVAAAAPARRPQSIELDIPAGELPNVRRSGANWAAVTDNGPVSPAPSTSRASSQSGSRPAVSVPTQDRPEPVAQAPNLSSTRGGSHQSGQHPAVARALRGETSRQQVEDRSVRDRILLPAIIAGAGIALSIVHGLYAAQTGEVPAIGPVRVGWIAGLLVVLGILIGVLRFTRPRA